MDQKPKILFVTPHWPSAGSYGGEQRTLNIARLLNRFCDLSYVIVRYDAADEETERRIKAQFDIPMVMGTRPLIHGNSIARLRYRLRHELDPAYMISAHRVVSESDCIALLRLMEEYDVVWVHHVNTAALFNIEKWPHSVLDVDDLPSRVYGSWAQSGGRSARPLRDRRMSWIWRRREMVLTKRFDVLTVCSEDDRRYLGNKAQIHVVPNGFHLTAAHRRISAALPRIGFIGLCTYKPNEEGIEWFVRDVWPLVKRGFPSAQLRLVGRGSDGQLAKLGPDIVGLGWLQDPSDEIASWSAMIVPIKFGGGRRIKIAEGFARKCPVVATTIGAFGYEVSNGEEIFLADSADDFASVCLQLLSNPQLGEALSERAHKRFLECWTWDSFQERVVRVVEDCLARSRDRTPVCGE